MQLNAVTGVLLIKYFKNVGQQMDPFKWMSDALLLGEKKSE